MTQEMLQTRPTFKNKIHLKPSKRSGRFAPGLLFIILVLVLWLSAAAIRPLLALPNHQISSGPFTLISVGMDGSPANSWSTAPTISADSRYIAFSSEASNLIPNDTNQVEDVFVYDREIGEISRISVASDGTEANYYSGYPTISMDGRYIAFASEASNLVPNDTNGLPDFFVHDRQTKLTTRVSLAPDGNEAHGNLSTPALSDNGRFVAFASDSPKLASGADVWMNLYVYDQQTGYLQPVSVASNGEPTNGASASPSISDDGTQIAFSSLASNLIQGDSNGLDDIFIFDSATGNIELVSLALWSSISNGQSYSPDISGDGRFVVFTSRANNLVNQDIYGASAVFIRDRQTGQTWSVSEPDDVANLTSQEMINFPQSALASISADGRYVSYYRFPYYTYPLPNANITFGYFIYDLQTQEIHHVADANNEDPGVSVGRFSSDGHYFIFTSEKPFVPDDTNEKLDIYLYENIAYRLPEAEPTATFTPTPVEPTATPRPLPTDTVTVVATSSATVPTTVTPAPTGTPLTESTPSTTTWLSGVLVVVGLVVVGGVGFIFLTRAR